MTQLRYEMANLKDKLNVVEQLLPTITGKYGLPHHPPDFREALSPFFFFFSLSFCPLDKLCRYCIYECHLSQFQ